ncbi:hypothetical protein DFH07DRAFT_947253, partial [Mycena maculata]
MSCNHEPKTPDTLQEPPPAYTAGPSHRHPINSSQPQMHPQADIYIQRTAFRPRGVITFQKPPENSPQNPVVATLCCPCQCVACLCFVGCATACACCCLGPIIKMMKKWIELD